MNAKWLYIFVKNFGKQVASHKSRHFFKPKPSRLSLKYHFKLFIFTSAITAFEYHSDKTEKNSPSAQTIHFLKFLHVQCSSLGTHQSKNDVSKSMSDKSSEVEYSLTELDCAPCKLEASH